MMFTDPSENDPQAAFLATMGLGPTQPYTTEVGRRRGGRQAAPQRQAAQPQMAADAFAPPQPLAQPTEQPESMWGPQGGNVNAMHVNPLPVLREAAGAVGMTFAPLAALGEGAYQAIGGRSGAPPDQPQQPAGGFNPWTAAPPGLGGSAGVPPQPAAPPAPPLDQRIGGPDFRGPVQPRPGVAGPSRDTRIGGPDFVGPPDPNRGVAPTPTPPGMPGAGRAFAPVSSPVINGATPPRPGELQPIQSYDDILRSWRMYQSDYQMRNPNYGGGAGVALNDVLNFNGPGYQRAQEASNEAMRRSFEGMYGIADSSEKGNQSQQKINLEGNRLGLDRTRDMAQIGLNTGQLAVNQRAQQLAELKGQYDMHGGAQLMRSIHALTMKPGQTPEGLRNDVSALMEQMRAAGPMQPAGMNAGAGFGTPTTLQPFVGGTQPGGPGGGSDAGSAPPVTQPGVGGTPPGRPGVQPTPGGTGTVGFGGALTSVAPPTLDGNGRPVQPPTPEVTQDIQWAQRFGQENYNQIRGANSLQDAAIKLARIMQGPVPQGQERVTPQAAMEYLNRTYGDVNVRRFMQPTSGQSFSQSLGNAYSNPPEEQVVASMFRNFNGLPANRYERYRQRTGAFGGISPLTPWAVLGNATGLFGR